MGETKMACLHEINIRLTNFCNETCNHCVYRSSPKFNTHLTTELSEQINEWFPKSENKNISMFGGELTLIPHYPELIKNLCKKLDQAGLITNGVFINKKCELDKFIDMIYNVSMRMWNFTIRVSQSGYHSPKEYGIKAYDKLSEIFENSKNIYVQLAGQKMNFEVIPFGRAFDNKIYKHHWVINPEAMCRST
jgi:MoaA/NifB/PqqE/SkfB family radical SAM enzyme